MSISHRRNSFSLIEVLIFVTILSMFLITAAAIITVSMRQNTLRINMLKATHYNDQVLEWLRGEKDVSWTDFTVYAGNNIICYDTDILSSGTSVATKSDCQSTLGGMYRRYAEFRTTPNAQAPTQVEATIYTEWKESGNNFFTKVHSLFTLWE